jgi:hypothetical protein
MREGPSVIATMQTLHAKICVGLTVIRITSEGCLMMIKGLITPAHIGQTMSA